MMRTMPHVPTFGTPKLVRMRLPRRWIRRGGGGMVIASVFVLIAYVRDSALYGS